MPPLRVAIVHYHLRRGGVTRVIENSLLAPTADVQTLIFSGEAGKANGSQDVPVCVLPALAYDAPYADASGLRDEARRLCTHELGGPPDVWHFHNHALGKNRNVPALVNALAAAGEKLLLHIHDFAEDGRPENYAALKAGGVPFYPDGTHVHYGALNSRDYDILQAAGAGNLHKLPNPVTPPAPNSPKVAETPSRILYPTRAIRRKNIGEILLWAAVQKDVEAFWVTLAPENPRERPAYDAWVALAEALELPIEFEAVARKPFQELVAECSHFITTSVSEGFGLAFLEGWLADRPLLGRNLSEITPDFKREGIDLSGLYEAIQVPCAWIDMPTFDRKLRMALQRSAAAYGIRYTEDRFIAAREFLTANDRLDFGRLDEELQAGVIRHLARSPADSNLMDPRVLTPPATPGRTAANRKRIADTYSPQQYRSRLLSLYRSLSASDASPVTMLDPLRILEAFLKPERVNLLRS